MGEEDKGNIKKKDIRTINKHLNDFLNSFVIILPNAKKIPWILMIFRINQNIRFFEPGLYIRF